MRTFIYILFLFFSSGCFIGNKDNEVHVFEKYEILLTASNNYENPYTDVTCWVQLEGPGFNKKVYGFWDGGQQFRIRIIADKPGHWSWESGSNSPDDDGLNNRKGTFIAVSWTEGELQENPNRRGFVRVSDTGHSLSYADGTPFFFIGDTWWSASTWRYPLSGNLPDSAWQPGPENLTFENLVLYRKNQGYNSVAIIASFPNWAVDSFPANYVDKNGIGIRQAWEKFGTDTSKDMHDEYGNLPFELTGNGPLADFDRINPKYFQSLDRKMSFLDSVGFVPLLETIRRDHGPAWKAYFDWPGSFTRYIQYIAARYGANNMIFSPIHLDWIPPKFSLSGEEFNQALNAWHREYGALPFGQPVTSLINPATHIIYGTGDEAPWLTMHSVGNSPRNHGFYPLLEEQFNIVPNLPTCNLEPYYPGWNQAPPSIIAGELAERNSERDNYFGRTQAWGSVFSGGLAGHMYGTGAYDGTTVGEQEGKRPLIWDALKYPSGKQMGFLRKFIESELNDFQHMQPASENLHPRKSNDSEPDGLDGWSFMLNLPDKSLALIYFENKSLIPVVSGFKPNEKYKVEWFDPETGDWLNSSYSVISDDEGVIHLNSFPDGSNISSKDWSVKVKSAN